MYPTGTWLTGAWAASDNLIAPTGSLFDGTFATSPVGGASGRFEVDPRGRVIIEPRKVTLTKTRLPEDLRMGPGEFLRTLRREEDIR